MSTGKPSDASLPVRATDLPCPRQCVEACLPRAGAPRRARAAPRRRATRSRYSTATAPSTRRRSTRMSQVGRHAARRASRARSSANRRSTSRSRRAFRAASAWTTRCRKRSSSASRAIQPLATRAQRRAPRRRERAAEALAHWQAIAVGRVRAMRAQPRAAGARRSRALTTWLARCPRRRAAVTLSTRRGAPACASSRGRRARIVLLAGPEGGLSPREHGGRACARDSPRCGSGRACCAPRPRRSRRSPPCRRCGATFER